MTTMTRAQEPETDLATRRKKARWTVMPAFAALGAVVGYFGASLFKGGENAVLAAITWSQGTALALGALLLMCVVVIALGYAFPALGLRMAMFEDREEWQEQRAMMVLSGIGCATWAILLVGMALAEPFGWTGSAAMLAVLCALALAMVAASWRLLWVYDELWQGVNNETCTFAFYLTFLVGGAWSVAAHMRFAPAPSPLDWISILTAASIVGAVIATQRRGMLNV
jgi:hypothetical protein